ncbi:GDSL esterase/lipase-like protein [Salvia divinorum]|uniref:GDSL esterase/lipase-like protein n=1 Tax=Salvia divinorum TaxID=28513 RepID=A0ABD1GVN7_SALDI
MGKNIVVLQKAIYSFSHLLIVITFFVELSWSSSRIPANFIFGDSLVDAGNNNYIASLSKADFAPNGIDFGKPTGRFTNAKTIVDILGQEIGLSGFTPPYLAPTTNGAAILRGVNYASGGAGIFNYTGKIFGGRINLDAQLDNFANTRQAIISAIGEDAAINLFRNALFSIAIGSNDFINNYLTPVISKVEQHLVSPQSFVAAMISRFRTQLMRLKKMGAKIIIVANVGPIGCIPYQRDVNPCAENQCVALPNQLAQLFNAQLRSVVQQLNTNLDGSKFIYADVYHIVDDIMRNYASYGFENSNSACCHSAGRFGGLIPCGPTSKICEDRSKYVFWDPFHPTDAANFVIAMRLMHGRTTDIWPINISQLLIN